MGWNQSGDFIDLDPDSRYNQSGLTSLFIALFDI